MVTQSAFGLLALVLGALVITGWVRLWMVCVCALGYGVVTAVDNPTRQSFVVEMVGEGRLAVRHAADDSDAQTVQVVQFGLEHADRCILFHPVEVDVEEETRIRLELLQFLPEKHSVRAQVDMAVAREDLHAKPGDVGIQQRLASADGNDGRAALVDRGEALLERDALADGLLVLADAAAARAGKVAGVERLQHQDQREPLLAREPRRLQGRSWFRQIEIFSADVMTPSSLAAPLEGVHTAYYLIHNMSMGRGYTERELEGARLAGIASRGGDRVVSLHLERARGAQQGAAARLGVDGVQRLTLDGAQGPVSTGIHHA